MRIVFFASSPYAVASLEALIAAGHEVVALVTEPDRGTEPGPEVVAGAWRIPVYEPAQLEGFEAELGGRAHDLQVVLGYGRALPSSVLDLPRYGTVKIHASLLPRYRGAAPIPRAILDGATETGVTALLVKDGPVDAGPVFGSRSTAVGAEETAAELRPRLAKLAAALLLETVGGLAEGKLKPKAQEASGASEAPAVREEEGRLDWNLPAVQLARQVRAFCPWPGSVTRFEGHTLKVLKATVADDGAGEPGVVAGADFAGIVVACAGGTRLRLTQLQLEGQRPMSPSAFVSRHRLRAGARLG